LDKKEFHAEIRDQTYSITSLAFWILCPIYVSWTLFDHYLAPQHWELFFVIRVGVLLLIYALLIFASFPKNRRHINIVTLIGASAFQCGIAIMLPLAGEEILAYVMGFGICLLAASFIVVWPPIYAYLVYLICTIAVMLAFLFIPSAPIRIEDLVASIFYISTIILVCGITVNLRYYAAKNEYIARSKLARAKKELEQIDAVKNDFIANITHDFRTPLMIIKNTAELGIIKNPMQSHTDHVAGMKTIYTASLRLKNTIDKLLDVAKMDAQGLKLHINRLPITGFIENLYQFYDSSLVHDSIKVNLIKPDHDIGFIYTDKEKLEQVINNLISNAVKFSKPDDGIITIELSDIGSAIRITIKDNGIGISNENLSRLFKRFEQVEGGRNSYYKGTGIGLAFSKQLVELLHGTIRAASEGEGCGAAFSIELLKGLDHFDMSEAEREAIGEDIPGIADEHELRYLLMDDIGVRQNTEIETFFADDPLNDNFDWKKAKILLVDDNRDILAIEKNFLELAGYQNFILAHNGKEGISAVYEHHPDIIICDFNMPEMRGDKFHDEIADNPDLMHVPFIFVSAVTDENVVLKRKKRGALAYLRKPIDKREFILTVETHLKRYMVYLKTVADSITDSLTRLNNRKGLYQHLYRFMAQRQYNDLSILFLDLDHFKRLNDTHGHPFGDSVLREVGKTILDLIRSSDIAGRYGGEEFVIGCPDTSLSEAILLGKKLCRSIASLEFFHGGETIQIHISIGIASLKDGESYLRESLALPTSVESIFAPENPGEVNWLQNREYRTKILEALIKMADTALYQAKKTQCADCGFASEKDQNFDDDKCPECGGTKLIKGRNRVIAFGATPVKTL
jgi:diguanylate cyclase (GGDEF)-like protein